MREVETPPVVFDPGVDEVRPPVRIRYAVASEGPRLEALQRRASAVWEEYREPLAAHPDAIELPQTLLDNSRVRVAVGDDETPLGFSVVVPRDASVYELDGLFVEPTRMGQGIGRALIEDLVAIAAKTGAASLEVTAGPAQGFYERVGFRVTGEATTRFGPAVRMRRELQRRRPRRAAS